MKEKKLWKTKSFWGGLASIATGVGFCVAGDYPGGFNMIAVGLMGIFVRHGIETTAKKTDGRNAKA